MTSNPSTETKPTDETTRETHLVRLEDLEQDLFTKAFTWVDDPACARPQGPYLQAASVRWAIEELSE